MLHDASHRPEAAKRIVAPLADTAPQTLSTITIADLRGDGTVTSWPLKLEACSGEPSNVYDLREALQRVEGHLDYSRPRAADQMLKAMRNLLGCLQQPAPPTMASRVFFLSGILSAEEGSPNKAKLHFARALAIYPALTWDETYAPKSGMNLFDAAKEAQNTQAPGTLHAVPGTVAYAVWIDGVALSPESPRRELVPGKHLVQVGSPDVTSYWAEIRPYESLYVFVRNELHDSAIVGVTDPNQSEGLSALLASTVGVGTPVYVVASKTNVVFAKAGETSFETARPAVSAAPIRTPRTSIRTPSALSAPTLMTWSGSAITVGAGAWALQAKLRGNQLYRECWDGTVHNASACEANEQAYQTVRTQLPIAEGVTIGGVAIAGLGLAWGKATGVSVTPFGSGLQLTVRK